MVVKLEKGPKDIVNPAGKYMFKVIKRNIGTRCEICSKLTIKAPKLRQWIIFYTSVSIVNFELANTLWERPSIYFETKIRVG